MIGIGVEDPASSDAKWCLGHYFAELRERFEDEFDPDTTLPVDDRDLVPPGAPSLSLESRGSLRHVGV